MLGRRDGALGLPNLAEFGQLGLAEGLGAESKRHVSVLLTDDETRLLIDGRKTVEGAEIARLRGEAVMRNL